MRAGYLDAITKLVDTVLEAADLSGFPDAPDGRLAVLTDYLGPLPAYWTGTEILPLPPQPSPAHEWSGTALAWVLNPDLLPGAVADAQASAQGAIDAAAGRARLRYITDVPGQQATYQRKELQAREWAEAGYTGDAPSFIAAEAAALGVPPQQVAQQVIALADYWAYVKGPEIEAARIAGKAAVRASETLDAVQAALDAAIAQLDAL